MNDETMIKTPADTPTETPPAIAAAAPPESPQNQNASDELPQKKADRGEDLGDDVQVEFSLVVRSREGVILDIKNAPKLPMALHPAMLTEALRQFETVIDDLLVRPAKVRFTHFIQKRKEADVARTKTIGTGLPGEAENNSLHPLMLVSPPSPTDYPSTLAECIAHNRRLESGN